MILWKDGPTRPFTVLSEPVQPLSRAWLDVAGLPAACAGPVRLGMIGRLGGVSRSRGIFRLQAAYARGITAIPPAQIL